MLPTALNPLRIQVIHCTSPKISAFPVDRAEFSVGVVKIPRKDAIAVEYGDRGSEVGLRTYSLCRTKLFQRRFTAAQGSTLR